MWQKLKFCEEMHLTAIISEFFFVCQVSSSDSPLNPKVKCTGVVQSASKYRMQEGTLHSGKSGKPNPALNELYPLMRQLDHYQIFARP